MEMGTLIFLGIIAVLVIKFSGGNTFHNKGGGSGSTGSSGGSSSSSGSGGSGNSEG